MNKSKLKFVFDIIGFAVAFPLAATLIFALFVISVENKNNVAIFSVFKQFNLQSLKLLIAIIIFLSFIFWSLNQAINSGTKRNFIKLNDANYYKNIVKNICLTLLIVLPFLLVLNEQQFAFFTATTAIFSIITSLRNRQSNQGDKKAN